VVIYKITNIKNNKIYIGLTIQSALNRFSSHISEAKRMVDKSYLNNALRKYGKESFKVEIIDAAKTIEELKKKEIYYISFYNSTNRKIGYNLSLGGDGTPGVSKSEETRNKIRQKALGRIKSEESKRKQSETLRKGNYTFEKGINNCKQYNLKTSKVVEKLNENFQIVETYQSITEASFKNNIDRIGLTRYIKNNSFEKYKKYKNFYYRLKE